MEKKLNKLRPYLVAKILYEKTDEDHFLTIAQINKLLEERYGITAYRATIKEDLDLLIEAGLDIEFVKSSQNKYHVISREFEIPELKILIDAVESSKFIPKSKSSELAEKLCRQAGPYMAKALKRNVDVEGRLKTDNEQVYYITDVINEAINEQKKIRFQYFQYNIRKERIPRHDGYWYTYSPYKLVWNGDYYYVVGWSDKHDGIATFRIDRMLKTPELLEEAAVPEPAGFDIDHYLNSMFRMYSGERREVELVCANDLVDAMVDRFGEDVEILACDMENFRIIINTAVSSVFYAWVFGFSGKVKIKAPQDVQEEYLRMVIQAGEGYEVDKE